MAHYLAFVFTFLISAQTQENLSKFRRVSERVEFVDVGQGDGAAFLGKHSCVFIDMGGSNRLPISRLQTWRRMCLGKNNILFITHFDKDHLNLLPGLLKFVHFSTAYVSHLRHDTRTARNAVANLQRMIPEIKIAHRFDLIQAQGFKAQVLWPPQGFVSKRIENDWSLALRIEFGGRSFFVAGDLPKRFEDLLNSSQVDVLKLSHHGSRTSTSDTFLKSIRPRMCIVSSGVGHYNHPHRETELRIKNAGCVELQTKILGDIIIEAKSRLTGVRKSGNQEQEITDSGPGG